MWKEEPTIADMNQAVQAALVTYQERVNTTDGWLKDMTTDSIPVKKGSSPKSTIVPKLVRKHAEWRYSSLTEPFHTAESLFTVEPITAAGEALAAQDHAILAYQSAHELNTVKFIDDLVRTLVDEGTALVKVGWEFASEVREETTELLGMPVSVETEVTTKNMPTVDILAYDSFMIDPDCRGVLSKAKYVITKHLTTLHELKKKGYENLDRLEPSTSTNFGESNTTIERAFQKKERNSIEVNEYYGYWETVSGDLKPIIVTFAQGQILRVIESPYPFRTLPFALFVYMPIRNVAQGQPDAYLLKDSQQISGAITRGIIDLLGKSANGQTGYKQNALDSANLLKFQRGEDYVFRADSNPNEVIFQHIYPEIPNSALTMLQLQQQEAESLTGINTFGQGMATNSLGNGSAAAARGVMSYSAKREAGIIRRIADGLNQVGKMLLEMNRVFLDPEFIMSITDQPYVEGVGYDALVDVRINIRTAEADEASASDLAFLLQTIGNTLDPSFTQMIVAEIAKLKGLHALSDKIKTFKAEPNPMAEQQQQMQMQLLQAQLQNEQLKAQMLQAQIVTEGEKARKTGAEADMTNLEFIEEERGVNHERAIELVSKQAEGNMYHSALKEKLRVK